jgi:hypothetical protein
LSYRSKLFRIIKYRENRARSSVCPNLFFLQAFLELLDLSAAVDHTLFTSEHRMALGTNLHPDLLFGGAGFKCFTTRACHFCSIILGMNSFFHNCHLTCIPICIITLILYHREFWCQQYYYAKHLPSKSISWSVPCTLAGGMFFYLVITFQSITFYI